MSSFSRILSALVVGAVGLSATGCNQEAKPTSRSPPPAPTQAATPSTVFQAKSEGSPASLLAHLRLLEKQYIEANSEDLETSRANAHRLQQGV